MPRFQDIILILGGGYLLIISILVYTSIVPQEWLIYGVVVPVLLYLVWRLRSRYARVSAGQVAGQRMSPWPFVVVATLLYLFFWHTDIGREVWHSYTWEGRQEYARQPESQIIKTIRGVVRNAATRKEIVYVPGQVDEKFFHDTGCFRGAALRIDFIPQRFTRTGWFQPSMCKRVCKPRRGMAKPIFEEAGRGLVSCENLNTVNPFRVVWQEGQPTKVGFVLEAGTS